MVDIIDSDDIFLIRDQRNVKSLLELDIGNRVKKMPPILGRIPFNALPFSEIMVQEEEGTHQAVRVSTRDSQCDTRAIQRPRPAVHFDAG